jgi:hypothetical protein
MYCVYDAADAIPARTVIVKGRRIDQKMNNWNDGRRALSSTSAKNIDRNSTFFYQYHVEQSKIEKELGQELPQRIRKDPRQAAGSRFQ